MAQISFRRFAKARENSGGMCWAITIPGVDAGSLVSTAAMASVPPVEAPIAMTVPAGNGGWFAVAQGVPETGTAGGDLRRWEAAAARILSAKVFRSSPTE